MLSAHEVEMAYRLILGREPESSAVVEDHRRVESLDALRDRFLQSPEFRSRTLRPIQTDIDYCPALKIDTDLEQSVLRKMFERVERCWQGLGNTEPYWSVISADKFRSNTFNSHEAEFYNSGKGEAVRLLAWIARNHIDPASIRTCCEYGCGVGRATGGLSSHFERVFAYDISEPHLNLARQHLLKEGRSNVTLHRIDSIASLSNLEHVDVVFSIIVLQHNPPPVIAHILRMLLRSLNPGGLAFFQVPTYALGYEFDAKHYLKSPPPAATCEMHVLPQSNIFRIALEEGCAVLEVQPDLYVRTQRWVSNTFLVQRDQARK
jgi:2-polyprenyl-3-methyl-5-hydroxy-6-metoxy-1,4-benzoquinol methylase